MKQGKLLLTCMYFIALARADNQPPNIVIILADDLGWNDFGFHGSSQIPTPNIDGLAYNGVILDKFYTQQSCTPSRAALLTGNYPIRSGLQGDPLSPGENIALSPDMPLLPEKLRELGYKTHLVGKWHLGAAYKNDTPTKRGFDSHFGYWNGYVGYFDYSLNSIAANSTKNMTGFDLHDGFAPQWQYMGRYATDLFTEKSLDVIEKHDQKDPLFLLLTHLAGHTGHDGTELGVPNATQCDEVYDYIKEPNRKRLAGIVNILDDSVGQVVKKLADKSMLNNSVIIFFSDNGAQTQGIFQNFASGWPLRGLKFTLFEGGVRGSCVIYSPLLKTRGYVNKQLMHISDWFPTLYYAAGGTIEDLGNIDGINQWEVISKNGTTTRTDILLNIDDVKNVSGMLGYNGQYKLLNGSYEDGIYDGYYGDSGRGLENPDYNIQLILNEAVNVAIQNISNGTLDEEKILQMRDEVDLGWCRRDTGLTVNCTNFCLFDIYNDPCETTNLIDKEDHQSIVTNLKEKLSRHWFEIVPQKARFVDPASNPNNCNNTWYTWLDEFNICS